MALSKDTKNLENVKFIQNKQKKVYGFGAFTVFVLIVLVVGAIRPSISTIIRLNKEIEVKGVTVDTLNNKIKTIGSLASQYSGFEDTAVQLSLIYPNTGDFSLFLANIESICARNDMELKGILFDEMDPGDKDIPLTILTPASVNISVVGPEDNLVALLQDLEGLPMFPEIQRVSYGTKPITKADDDESDIEKLGFSINMKLYKIDDLLFFE